MQLRPSGTKGPVAVSFAAFESYYAGEAETWEYLALTRARVVWATSPAFAARAAAAIEPTLRAPRDAHRTAADVRSMRQLMARERPASGFWDLKLVDGRPGRHRVRRPVPAAGRTRRQAVRCGPTPPRRWRRCGTPSLAPAELVDDLAAAWRLQQDLSQLLKVALPDGADPEHEPKALRSLMAKAAGVRDFRSLARRADRAPAGRAPGVPRACWPRCERRKPPHRAFNLGWAA